MQNSNLNQLIVNPTQQHQSIISIDPAKKSLTFVNIQIDQNQQGLHKFKLNKIKVYNITQKEEKKIPDIIENLKKALEDFENDIEYSMVIVEKQLGNFSFANLESAITMFYKMKNKEIIQINPRQKLKLQYKQVEQKYKKKYDQNKYFAREQFQYFLDFTNQDIPTQLIKNKSDIADATLQLLFLFH